MITTKRFLYHSVLLLLLGAMMAACASGPEVKRKEVDETIDLSGRWNDTDSRLVAEEMIEDCLGRPWMARFSQKHGGKVPVVIVGTVRNRSHEHINTQIFTKNLERELINSGLIDFVASKSERKELREEKKDQASGYTSTKTAKSLTEELGADFMLQGSINSIKDSIKGKYVILYQVNLELIEIETNRKAWIGEKQIKKVVKRSKHKF